MLSFLETYNTKALKNRSKKEFEKVVNLVGDGRTERSLRVRMGLLARAHVDKTFIDGAQKTALHQDATMAALAAGESPPEKPQRTLYQLIKTSGGHAVWAYQPEEYVQEVFQVGVRYQRMDITAHTAIGITQNLLDRIFRFEFKLNESLESLQFLRQQTEPNAGDDVDSQDNSDISTPQAPDD
jgi:hypothetical protein